jgi:hypothetical protein
MANPNSLLALYQEHFFRDKGQKVSQQSEADQHVRRLLPLMSQIS